MRLHGLQTPFQSLSGTAHCEWYFAPTTQSARADWPMSLCMASARIFKMHTHESHYETALRLHGLESGFLGGSRSKTPFFSRFKTRSKSLIWNSFCLHGLKSGFQIRKRPNHVLKRLSERDSSPCKHTHCLPSSSYPQQLQLSSTLTSLTPHGMWKHNLWNLQGVTMLIWQHKPYPWGTK